MTESGFPPGANICSYPILLSPLPFLAALYLSGADPSPLSDSLSPLVSSFIPLLTQSFGQTNKHRVA